MVNYTKKTFHNTIIVFVLMLGAAFFAYLFRLFLAKKLSLAEFGLFFSLTAFFSLIFSFKDLGILQSVSYYIPRFISKNDKSRIKGIIIQIFKIEFIIGILIMLGIIIFADIIIPYFHSTNNIIIILFVIAFFINSIELNFQIFSNAFQNQILYSGQNFVKSIIIFGLCVIGFKFYTGIYVPLFVYFISYVLIFIIFGFIFFKKTFPQFFGVKAKYLKFNELFLFGLPSTVAMLGFMMISYTDTLVLTYFNSLEDVGLYNAAIPIVGLMLYVPYAVSAVILPLTSELISKKKIDSVRFAVKNITNYTLIVLIPIAGILLFYPEITLNILFGEKFISAGSALSILAIGAIFYGIGIINLNFLLGIKGPINNAYIFISSAILNFIISIIIVPRYGIYGAALSTSLTYILIFMISTIYLYKELKLKLDFLNYFYIIFAGLIFIFVINYLKKVLNTSIFIESFITLSCAMLIFIAVLFLLKVINKKEISELYNKIFN